MACTAWLGLRFPLPSNLKAGSLMRFQREVATQSSAAPSPSLRQERTLELGLARSPLRGPLHQDWPGKGTHSFQIRRERTVREVSRLGLPCPQCMSQTSPVRTASFARQIPAHWLKLDKFLPSLLTEDYDVTAAPPSAP